MGTCTKFVEKGLLNYVKSKWKANDEPAEKIRTRKTSTLKRIEDQLGDIYLTNIKAVTLNITDKMKNELGFDKIISDEVTYFSNPNSNKSKLFQHFLMIRNNEDVLFNLSISFRLINKRVMSYSVSVGCCLLEDDYLKTMWYFNNDSIKILSNENISSLSTYLADITKMINRDASLGYITSSEIVDIKNKLIELAEESN